MTTLPDIQPDNVSSRKSTKARVVRTNFGDGYSQRIGDGLNAVRDEWNVQWTNITAADKETLVQFFEGLAGVTSFQWTPQGDSAAKNFTCAEWNVTPKNAYYYSLTAKFTQEFD